MEISVTFGHHECHSRDAMRCVLPLITNYTRRTHYGLMGVRIGEGGAAFRDVISNHHLFAWRTVTEVEEGISGSITSQRGAEDGAVNTMLFRASSTRSRDT